MLEYKSAIALKRVKVEEKLLWRAYRKSQTLFPTVPSPTPTASSSSRLGVRSICQRTKASMFYRLQVAEVMQAIRTQCATGITTTVCMDGLMRGDHVVRAVPSGRRIIHRADGRQGWRHDEEFLPQRRVENPPTIRTRLVTCRPSSSGLSSRLTGAEPRGYGNRHFFAINRGPALIRFDWFPGPLRMTTYKQLSSTISGPCPLGVVIDTRLRLIHHIPLW